MIIYTLKRSGSHAIFNWICRANEPAIHFNGCKDSNIQYPQNLILYNNNKRKFMGKNYSKKWDYFQKVDHKKYNMFLLYGFENCLLAKKKKYKKYKEAIILRDPRNWIASCLQVNAKPLTHLYKNYFKDDRYKILYDLWFNSKKYRKKICSDLKLKFSDKGLNEVYLHGKSSFDKKEFDGKAQKMKVLERYKEFENNDLYKIKIKEYNIVEKWEEILNKTKEEIDKNG